MSRAARIAGVSGSSEGSTAPIAAEPTSSLMVARAMPREELEATGSPPVQMHDLYDLLTLELRAEARNGLRPVSRWSATWAERFMFRWFESRIDPFARTGIVMPPSALLSFYWHFVRPIWPVFALILFFDLLAAISEVLLATFVAQLIDLMKSAVSAASFFSDHAGLLVWMAFVILVARPTIIFVYELLKNQVLSPPFQTSVRWQTHGYMLRQSLDFFQNEFAGGVAKKLMQTAPAIRDSFITLSDAAVFVAVQWLSAIVLFWAADPRLIIPLVAWLAAYGVALVWFVPLIRGRSTVTSQARSTLLFPIVYTYTTILTLNLLSHAYNDNLYAPTPPQ